MPVTGRGTARAEGGGSFPGPRPLAGWRCLSLYPFQILAPGLRECQTLRDRIGVTEARTAKNRGKSED